MLLSETKSSTMMPGRIRIKVETHWISVNPVFTMFQWLLLFVWPLLTIIYGSTRWEQILSWRLSHFAMLQTTICCELWFGLILHLPSYGLHWKPQLSDDKLSAFAGHWVDFLIQYGYLIRLSIRLSFNLNLCLFEFGARSGGEHMKRHQDNKEWAYRLTYRYRFILQLQAYQSHANPIKANDSARSVINWIAYCDYFHQVLSYVLDHCLCYSHVFAFISDNLNLMCLC